MDSVVLNSVSNITKAITPLADYTVIQCYLDNDAAGRAALARLRYEFGDKVMDKSALYPNNKDLNDCLISLYPKNHQNSNSEKRENNSQQTRRNPPYPGSFLRLLDCTLYNRLRNDILLG